MNSKTIHVGGEQITVTRHGNNDFDIYFRNGDHSSRGTMMCIILAFAEWQMAEIPEDPAVSFAFDGVAICNPWYDETGRFPQSTYQACRMYGDDNVLRFVADAYDLLRPDDDRRE